MWDLLRFARAARSVGGLVGGWRNPTFRAFSVVLTCAGVGFLFGGATAFGLFLALALWVCVWLVNSRTFGGSLLGSGGRYERRH